MMDRIEDMDGNIISEAIYDLIPSLKGHQIKNRLLDGRVHIQTIGDATKYLRFRCVSKYNQIEIINNIEFIGERIRVIYDDQYYIGIINELEEWEEAMFGEKYNRLYTSNIRLVVLEEGVI